MNNETRNGFSFSYSAAEQEEVRAIREKYTAPDKREEATIDRLRRLDASVTRRGEVFSLILGVIGTLLLGLGMSLIMTNIAVALGWLTLPLGIAVGAVGIALIALAYPVYTATVKKDRARLAPEILRLTDELIK